MVVRWSIYSTEPNISYCPKCSVPAGPTHETSAYVFGTSRWAGRQVGRVTNRAGVTETFVCGAPLTQQASPGSVSRNRGSWAAGDLERCDRGGALAMRVLSVADPTSRMVLLEFYVSPVAVLQATGMIEIHASHFVGRPAEGWAHPHGVQAAPASRVVFQQAGDAPVPGVDRFLTVKAQIDSSEAGGR